MMLFEPGFFRTELLSNDSTTYAPPTVDDYAERTKNIVVAWKRMDGQHVIRRHRGIPVCSCLGCSPTHHLLKMFGVPRSVDFDLRRSDIDPLQVVG